MNILAGMARQKSKHKRTTVAHVTDYLKRPKGYLSVAATLPVYIQDTKPIIKSKAWSGNLSNNIQYERPLSWTGLR